MPGLAFISLLTPVTYNLNIHRENDMVYKGTDKDKANWAEKYDIEKVRMTGFLEQQVAEAAKKSGYDFSGVRVPADSTNSLYSIRYSDFVVPLVKAVQELNGKNENQQTTIELQQTTIKTQQTEIDDLKTDYDKKIELMQNQINELKKVIINK